ncbi:MAG: hypothetical protein WCO11_01895 [Sphingomonadales bacterium]|jgi:hypothetical protein
MIARRSAAILLAATMIAAPAAAQAWIGTMVGNMIAQQQAAAAEAACKAGTPAAEKVQAFALASSEAAMAGYAALTPASKPTGLKTIFALKDKDVSWKDEGGPAPIPAFLAKLPASPASLTRVAFVVAGDGTTARGIWKVAVPGQPDANRWYAVDLKGAPGRNMWGGGEWRIWHFAQFSGAEPPPAPAAYCHWDPDQAW